MGGTLTSSPSLTMLLHVVMVPLVAKATSSLRVRVAYPRFSQEVRRKAKSSFLRRLLSGWRRAQRRLDPTSERFVSNVDRKDMRGLRPGLRSGVVY